MRAAFAPTSLFPTRETERMSRREPPFCDVMRITMSSLKPYQKVVSVASIRPAFDYAATISQPSSRATASALSKVCGGGMARIAGAMSGYARFCCAATLGPL